MPVPLQRYDDSFRGWPVRPQNRQHPVRGSFLDPRPDPQLGAIYHTGVDIAVRDDRREPGAPAGRTHRVYAIEGGVVRQATAPGVCGNVRVGHFGYGHVDARVKEGDRVRAGQLIGWTCLGWWHMHLTEWIFEEGRQPMLVNPLRPAGKLKPFVDRAAPVIHDVRFFTPSEPRWARRAGNAARLPQAGRRLDRTKLAGLVDVRARVSDPQSFIGWFDERPALAAPHHPYRLGLLLVRRDSGRVVLRRTVFLAATAPSFSAGQHYAPGTTQNLPAKVCLTGRGGLCDGVYWFRLFQRPYWNTATLPDGRYLLVVRAWDAAGNRTRRDIDIRIANPPV
jgi:hypothetical protein